MKRKASELSSDLPSPTTQPFGYAVRGGVPRQNTAEQYDKLVKLFDTTALDCQLRELLEQKQSDSEASEVEEENIKYYSLVPTTSIKNEPGSFGSYESNKTSTDAHLLDNSVENDNSSPANVTDDVLRHIPASVAGKFKGALGLSSSVSIASSAPTSVNGSVTTKTSSPYTSSNNSLISDEDDDSFALNFNGSDDDPDFNNYDSDPDVTIPLSDEVIEQLFRLNEQYKNKIANRKVEDAVDFINGMHSANKKYGNNERLSFINADKKKLRTKKRLSALKTEETLKGALSTFKTPLLLPSLAPEKPIKSEVVNPKSIPKRKAQEKIPSMPAKKKRKKKTNSDTTSLTDQVIDVNTSHSTFSLDSYFIDELEIPSSSKPRSASSTSSLDNKVGRNTLLKNKTKSRKTLQQLNSKRRSIYISICKNEIPKASKRREMDIMTKSEVLSVRAENVLKELQHKVLKPVVKPSECQVFEKRIRKDEEMLCDNDNLEDIARQKNENEDTQLRIIPSQVIDDTHHTEEVLVKPAVVKKETIQCDLSTRQHLANSWIYQQISREHLVMLCSGSENEKQFVQDYIVQLARQFRKVCNHPQLIESKKIQTPLWQKGFVRYPNILSEFRERSTKDAVLDKFCIYHPDRINRSLFRRCQIDDLHISEWSFLKLMGINLSALFEVHFGDFGSSLRLVQEIQRASAFLLLKQQWERDADACSSSLTILTDVERTMSPANVLSSQLLQDLVFTCTTDDMYGYVEHKVLDYNANAKTKNREPKETSHLLPTGLPAFLYCVLPKVIAARSLNFDCPNLVDLRNLEMVLSSPIQQQESGCFDIFSSKITLTDIKLKPELSCFKLVKTPQRSIFVDSGKLIELSRLLEKLYEKHSRVIIYCHVQRMTRIIEQYLKKQSWSYLNLDYLSHFSKYRNESSDCFIYLASRKSLITEVNSLSVDTVIFYDKELSLVEKQRSERLLNQLKQGGQITAYKLVSKDDFKQQQVGMTFGINEVALNIIHGDKYLENECHLLEKSFSTGLLELSGTDGTELPEAERENQGENRKNLIEEITDSSDTDSDSDLDSIRQLNSGNTSLQGTRFFSKSSKIPRGTGRRGRPPTRLRFRSRDIEADGGRRPGRPRLKRFGPINQGTRGRRPGRPRKSDASISSVSSNTASDIIRSVDLEQEMSQDAYSVEAISSV